MPLFDVNDSPTEDQETAPKWLLLWLFLFTLTMGEMFHKLVLTPFIVIERIRLRLADLWMPDDVYGSTSCPFWLKPIHNYACPG